MFVQHVSLQITFRTSDGWSPGSTSMCSTVLDFTFPIPTWEMTSAPRASMAPTAPAHASLWVRAGRAAGALSSFLHGISGDPSTAVLGPVPRCVVLLLLAGTLHFDGGPSKAVVWGSLGARHQAFVFRSPGIPVALARSI